MFGSKKKENPTSKNSLPSSTSNSLNSLVKGTKVEGTVSSESDIRIDGTIIGTLTCKAKVIIGPSGVVEGDVKCENAVIEGRFEGNLDVAQLLTIKEAAVINGDIKTNKLLVQSGAVFNVSCQMGSGHSKVGKKSAAKNIINGGQTTQTIGQKATQKVG